MAAKSMAAELNRIYDNRIRPDILADVARSAEPTAILVLGPVGAAERACAVHGSQLASTGGTALVPDAEILRAYHPKQNTSPENTHITALRHDLERWRSTLITDVIQIRSNVVVAMDPSAPEETKALSLELSEHGYRCVLRTIAADRDTCRQLAIARLDRFRSAGLTSAFEQLDDVDRQYAGLRATVILLQREGVIDRIHVQALSERPLAEAKRVGGSSHDAGTALRALDDYRDRQRTARELADSVLRWHTLVQRVAVDPSVPRNLASQVLQWRDQAVQAAQQDPEASRFIAWGLEAEAFRKMDRSRFSREFPGSSRAVEKLDEAVRYADREFSLPFDRARFIDQARDRIAERIAAGRMDGPVRSRTKDRDPKIP